MSMKKTYNYFTELEKMMDYSYESVVFLHGTLSDFDEKSLKQKMVELQEMKRASHLKKQDIMSNLVKAFITPMEREDILSLARDIDHVTEAANVVLMKIYVFHVKTITSEALEFAGLVEKYCATLKAVVKEFRNFHKSTVLWKSLQEFSRLREEKDGLYTRAVRKLYQSSKDPIELLIWTELFDSFAKCCDACECVAQEMESAVMKNS